MRKLLIAAFPCLVLGLAAPAFAAVHGGSGGGDSISAATVTAATSAAPDHQDHATAPGDPFTQEKSHKCPMADVASSNAC